MFEDSKLIAAGRLFIDNNGDWTIGIQLKTRDDRIITVSGLTNEECEIIETLYGEVVILDLRVAYE